MNSINFVILGDFQVASELSKKGTTTDLSIFDRRLKGVIYTWTVPITFPKIQSLMQVINSAEYAILNVTKIDKYLGEQIIALDAVRVTKGFILHSYEVDEAKLKTLIRSTTNSNFKILNNINQLKQEMRILGVIRQGTVKIILILS